MKIKRLVPISIHEILASYTINGAKTMGQENITGSLVVGKKADLIILDQNIVALVENGEADKISDTQVVSTVFNGVRVYQRP